MIIRMPNSFYVTVTMILRLEFIHSRAALPQSDSKSFWPLRELILKKSFIHMKISLCFGAATRVGATGDNSAPHRHFQDSRLTP